MTKRNEVYKCSVCGNIVEVLHPAGGTLVCCGKPMELMKENTMEASEEKHIPVVEKVEGGYRVTVGSAPHPMTQEHHIEWIELETAEGTMRAFTKHCPQPVAFFSTAAKATSARAYCNLHGLWRAQ